MNRYGLLKSFVLIVIAALAAISGIAQEPCQTPCGPECDVPAYTGKELDQKPRIVAKPEPKFSSDEKRRYARQVITLAAVLCGSGKVTDISVKEGITNEVNDKAIEAARRIQFIPAEKDGNKVSRFITLKYFVR